jgi:hypothetical protein
MAPALLVDPSVGNIRVDVGEPVRPRESSTETPAAARASQRRRAKVAAPAGQAGHGMAPVLQTKAESDQVAEGNTGIEPAPKLDAAGVAPQEPSPPATPKPATSSKAYELSTRSLIDGF